MAVFRFLAGGLSVVSTTGVSFVVHAGVIEGSKHDLTSLDRRAGTGAMVGTVFDDNGSACVYCHTPHAPTARSGRGKAPLWNREYPVSTFTPYKSPTLDSSVRQPSGLSLACLSCHDGTLAVDRVVKRPEGAAERAHLHLKMRANQDMQSCGECHRGGSAKFTELHDIGIAAFGQDLSDDHPVSIDYPQERQDPQFHTQPVKGRFANGVRLFDGRVECASCHDVHDPDHKPFLRASVEGSQLCLTCHIK
jgi:predicted CXXCH cytochrome family protein